MNRVSKLLLLLYLCSGCSLFRKSSKESTAYTSESSFSIASTQQQQLKKDLSEKTVVLTKDSSGSEITTTIWPRGSFRFSPENGFTGEAEKIQLTHKKSTKSENLKRAERQVKIDATVKKKTVSKSSAGVATKFNKTTTSLNCWLVLMALCCSMLAYIWYTNYGKTRNKVGK